MTDKTEKPAAPKARKSEKKGVNKSEEIRKIASAKSGKVRPKDVIAALKDRGIVVSSPQVSMVLKRMGFRRRSRGTAAAGRSAGSARMGGARASGPVTVEDLLTARKLAEQLGGTDRALLALEALKRLD